MAFKWWKCSWCLGWNWTADTSKCPRCKRERTAITMPETVNDAKV